MSSVSTLVPVEEYLRTSYRPNCEYIDGVLRPKPMPTTNHGVTQALVVIALRKQAFDAAPEVTLKMSPSKFLVPDVVADVRLEHPYPSSPVKLCVEILSPEDRFSAVLSKCEEYHDWGVPYCWVIDPVKRIGWEYHAHGDLSKIEASGTLGAGEMNVALSELFVA